MRATLGCDVNDDESVGRWLARGCGGGEEVRNWQEWWGICESFYDWLIDWSIMVRWNCYEKKMGVGKGFWEQLRPLARTEDLSFLRGKRLAVDLSYWLVQQQTALKDHRVRKPHLRLTFFRVVKLVAKVYPTTQTEFTASFPVREFSYEFPFFSWNVTLPGFRRILLGGSIIASSMHANRSFFYSCWQWISLTNLSGHILWTRFCSAWSCTHQSRHHVVCVITLQKFELPCSVGRSTARFCGGWRAPGLKTGS